MYSFLLRCKTDEAFPLMFTRFNLLSENPTEFPHSMVFYTPPTHVSPHSSILFHKNYFYPNWPHEFKVTFATKNFIRPYKVIMTS